MSPCDGLLSVPGDLTWLLHQAANRMRCALDGVAGDCGLTDARDWVVLSALADGQARTQLELSRLLGLDKTTLIAILDRMERRELIVRAADPADRRVRIPKITETGRQMQAVFEAARDQVELRMLGEIGAQKLAMLVDVLTQIAALEPVG